MKIIKSKIFIIVLLVILLSKSLYFETYGSLYFEKYGHNILLFLLMPFLNFKKIQKNDLLLGGGIALISLLSFKFVFSTYLVMLMLIFLSIVIVNNVPFEMFSKYYIKILLFLSIMSLFSYAVLFFDISSSLSNFIPTDKRVMRNFLFFGVWDNFVTYNMYRNSGLWWEPGAFQIFVNLAFLFSIINDSLNKRIYLIYLITIITINSTTGFIVFFLLSFVAYEKKITLKNLVLILFTLIIFVLSGIYSGIFLRVYEKIAVLNGSLLSRAYDDYISLYLFSKNIFFGYGLGNIEYNITNGIRLIGEENYAQSPPTGSNGIILLLAQTGIFSLFYLRFLLFPKYYKIKSLFKRILIAMSLFFCFNTENFSLTLIFYLLIFYGSKSVVLKKIETPLDNNSHYETSKV